ncbi:hypothetical protein P5673_022715 [Acropora cervicornis]|uniref:Uncharacterized protein n=1 Tax=Acropora cervicornis TaxID=6130 RepID=A0AAD9Q7C8_ACRCE|nr:hypothetical protein P5673_022715 [Acropora cervicornis]
MNESRGRDDRVALTECTSVRWEVYRAIVTGRTDKHNITLRARFKRSSGKEKDERQTKSKRRSTFSMCMLMEQNFP